MKDVKILIPLTEVTLGADGRGCVTVSVMLTGESKERIVLTAVSPPGGAPMAAGPRPAPAPVTKDEKKTTVSTPAATPPDASTASSTASTSASSAQVAAASSPDVPPIAPPPAVKPPVVPGPQPIEAWTTIERPLREISAGVVEQYLVTFDGSQLAAGRFPVLLIAFPADEAPEEYADRGQTVTVIIPAEGTPPVVIGRRIPWLLIAIAATVLVLVIGVGSYFVFRTPNVEVPTVTRLAEQLAVDRLTARGFTVRVSETTNKDLGIVVTQDPAAGQVRKKGSEVILLVDHGAEVPDLTGSNSAGAKQKLIAAGLRMQAQPVPGIEPFDVVIGQDVAPAKKVAKGTTVNVKVRVGVVVPQLVGCSFASAQDILQKQGFLFVARYIPSNRPINEVVTETPPSGGEAGLGSTITLELSGTPVFGPLRDCEALTIKLDLGALKALQLPIKK